MLAKDEVGRDYAVKRIMVHDPGHLKGIKQEFDVNLMLSNHPNIVKLVGWDQVHGTRGEAMAVAVMEFCPGNGVV